MSMLNLIYPGMPSATHDSRRVSQQVNRPAGPRAHPKHLLALAAAKKKVRVRVEPTNEDNRHILRHPNGMAFRNTGSVEWPLDRFTQRRLREGSIKIVEEVVGNQRTPVAEPAARTHNRRSTAHTSTPTAEK